MIFNSVTYLLFLSITALVYWQLPLRARHWLILASSICFYGFWRFDFVWLMLFSAAVDFSASLRMHAATDQRVRKRWLVLSLSVNLGLLFVFKYLMFAADNVSWLAARLGLAFHPSLSIVLPLGISFYTFQTMSYTIDVYRRRIQPLTDPLVYGCFVTFFPQLVAGPILRASEIVSQLRTQQRWHSEHLLYGLRRILFGLFLKVGLADNIAPLVDQGFALDVGALSALDVWTLAFLFGFQIYFDFAGYSHIAIGSARLLGIVLPENFRFPYLASSPRDFWRRWHITLSSWIRDYLYLPLMGVPGGDTSQGGLGVATPPTTASVTPSAPVGDRARTLALFASWAIMGLWHGAAWTFLWWGVYHAALVYGHRRLSGIVPWPAGKSAKLLGWALTLAAMMLGWIPFRALSMHQALTLWGYVLQPSRYGFLGMRENTYLVAALVLAGTTAAGLLQPVLARPEAARRPLLWWPAHTLAYGTVAVVVYALLRPVRQFIYFQF